MKNANPEAVYIFIPGGGQPAAIGKALAERGLPRRLQNCSARANSPTPRRWRAWATPQRHHHAFHYTLERDNPLNNDYVKAYRDANNGRSPTSSPSAAMTGCT